MSPEGRLRSTCDTCGEPLGEDESVRCFRCVRQASLFARVFETDDGREVLDLLETQFGVKQLMLDTDPVALGMSAGARNVLLWVRSWINLHHWHVEGKA